MHLVSLKHALIGSRIISKTLSSLRNIFVRMNICQGVQKKKASNYGKLQREMNLISSTYQLLARKEFKLRDKRFEMNGRVRILWLHVMIILIE